MEHQRVERHDEERLDEALEESFPASDPYALQPVRSGLPSPYASHIAHLNRMLAELFALYVATKGCHWHISGPHFRDYHRLLDGQASEILATTDPVAERIRKLGAGTLSSIWDVETHATRRYPPTCDAQEMLRWLLEANRALASLMRETHVLCEQVADIATAGLLEAWIDEAEGRIWFLFEATRQKT